ncbi:long-chain-fatty-acid--CoA ligase (plasmid) [Arthrobacter sp. Z1-9]
METAIVGYEETIEGSEMAMTASPGLMMDFPLTTTHFLWRMRNVHPDSRIVSVRDADGESDSQTFAETADRCERLAAALDRRGIRRGDHIASFAWNNAEHMETYLGIMGMGVVLHTINLRLHDDQIVWTVRHARDRVLIVDDSLSAQIFPLLPLMPSVEFIVVIGDGEIPAADLPVIRYADIIEEDAQGYAFPALDERCGAALCYTSGTTGDPKGVLYSHRSIVLHALTMAGGDVVGIHGHDVVLATVSMFHAVGWGLPFIAIVTGADLIMPSRYLQPASLARMISAHEVTWSAGVPTIWMDLIRYLDSGPEKGSNTTQVLASVRKLFLGGSQVPRDLIVRMRDDFDVDVVSGWGMTETFPGAAVTYVDPRASEEELLAKRVKGGRVSPFYEVRIVAEDGAVLPHDGKSRGELEVRGPMVSSHYYGLSDEQAADKFHDGWLRTGDISTVDREGWITLLDRSKDVIKSGGEWISSVDLEQALLDHPDIHEVAVVARSDPRWMERPHAFIVASDDLDTEALREFLADKVPKWWVPEHFERIEEIPRTTTGKHNKRELRARFSGEAAITEGEK